MNIIALDLGTKCGFAYGEAGNEPQSGTWTLATPKEIREWGKTRVTRRCDPRPQRLYDRLHDLCDEYSFVPHALVFEDVEFQTYTLQCQLWSSLRTAAWFFSHNIVQHIDCVPVSTLKKYATGSGGADKEQMKKALLSLTPSWVSVNMDDNQIDALWIFRWASDKLGRMKL